MQKTTGYISDSICFHHFKISRSSSLLGSSTNRVDKYLSNFKVRLTNDNFEPLPLPIKELIKVS